MKELPHFKATGVPVITAAIAGISKVEWIDGLKLRILFY